MRRLVTAAVAAAVALAGCGGDDRATTQTAGAQPQGGAPGPGGGGFLDDEAIGELADELDVSPSKLRAAIRSAMPARPQGTPPAGATPPAGQQPPEGGPPDGAGGLRNGLAATLAKQLDLPESEVEAALVKALPNRPQGTPDANGTPSRR